MKVAFITSEVVPFSKTGGLADVAGALPGALAKLGAEVLTISPLYRSVRRHPLKEMPQLITVPLGKGPAWGAVRRSSNFFFLEHDGFYDRDGLYGDGYGDYADNLARYVFLSRGALEFLKQWGAPPDIVHVHDWQTGLVPLYLKTLYRQAFPRTKTVFTIHNLAYQGRFWKGELLTTGLGWEHFTWQSLEYHDHINFLKGGLLHADALTTVSPTYAREIQTAWHGWGLDGVLRDRSKVLRGILNGVDYDEWNPERDPHLAADYSSVSLEGKAECKAALQKRCGLPVRPDVPVLSMVGRLAEQKGIDVLLGSLEPLLMQDVQVIVLGSGEKEYEYALQGAARRHAPKLSLHIAFNNAFAHQIQAGSDMLLVPSRYEPCGLTQIYALRYGTVPVVRSTGGLADTVRHGVTGFLYEHYNSEGLLWAVGQAIEAYRDRKKWTGLMKTGMAQDFGWDASAREYLKLYESLAAGREFDVPATRPAR